MDGVIISHIADMDGIFSAAIIMRSQGIKKENIFFSEYSVESILNIEKKIKKNLKPGMNLFITDLGVNASTVNIFFRILSFARKKGGKIFWFDHHTWDKGAIKKLASNCDLAVVGENAEFCAAEITAAELEVEDIFTKKFLRLVHISDFNLKPKDKLSQDIINSYVLGTTYYSSLDHSMRLKMTALMAEQLSKGVILPKFVVNAGKKFDSINRKRLSELRKTLYNGGILSIGFSGFISTNDACSVIMEKTKSDLAAYVNVESGKVHLRSKLNDCSVLARAFGGGGHIHASGFEIDKNKYPIQTNTGREKLVSEMLQKANSLYNTSKS